MVQEARSSLLRGRRSRRRGVGPSLRGPNWPRTSPPPPSPRLVLSAPRRGACSRSAALAGTPSGFSAWEQPDRWEWTGGLPGVRIDYDHRFAAAGQQLDDDDLGRGAARTSGVVDPPHLRPRLRPQPRSSDSRPASVDSSSTGVTADRVLPRTRCPLAATNRGDRQVSSSPLISNRRLS